MNEYKITYSGESEGYRIIVDRTEAAAKKFFKEQAKELDLGRITIDSVELVSDHAMATKRNERETLEVIRQLVADLGPNSYLATAFEGCFEDAEQNIEYDAALSNKSRLESAEAKLRIAIEENARLRDQLAESEKDYEAAHAANHALADEKNAEIAALKAQVLSPDELFDIQMALKERVDDDEEEATKAAAEIVNHADAPESIEFLEARNAYHIAKHDFEVIRELLKRVETVRTAGA